MNFYVYMNTYMDEIYPGMNSDQRSFSTSEVLLRIIIMLGIVTLIKFIFVKEKRRYRLHSSESPVNI